MDKMFITGSIILFLILCFIITRGVPEKRLPIDFGYLITIKNDDQGHIFLDCPGIRNRPYQVVITDGRPICPLCRMTLDSLENISQR